MDLSELLRHVASSGLGGHSWTLSADAHVWLVCITLIFAAVGRDLCAFSFRERWSWMMHSCLLQSLTAVLTTLAVVQASACGLLSSTVLLGLSAFAVVMPRSRMASIRAWTYCFLCTLFVTSIMTPIMLPALLPPTPLTLTHRGHHNAFLVPFSGARVFFAPTQSVVANPVLNVFDNAQVTTLVAQAPLTLHNTTFLSIGERVRLFQMQVLLDVGSTIALLGADSLIENCTIRCRALPCLWLHQATVTSVVLRDVRFAHEGSEWYFADGVLPASLCEGSSSSDSGSSSSVARSPIGCVKTEDAFATSAFAPVVPAMPQPTPVSSSPFSVRVDELREVAPLSMLALEHAPLILGVMSTAGKAVVHYAIIPLATFGLNTLLLAVEYARPLLQSAYVLSCKFTTAVSCGAIHVQYFQRLHCEIALHMYENDPHFAMMQSFIDVVVDALKDVHEVPLISPSLYITWNLEKRFAVAFWSACGGAVAVLVRWVAWVWPSMSSVALGPLLAVGQWVCHRAGWLLWWSLTSSLRWDMFDDWAWRINASMVTTLRFLLGPLLALLMMLLSALWGVLRMYQTTSFSTHILMSLLQSGLLGVILYRDFRSRVTSQQSSQSWFMRSIATIPMAVAGMFRHYSARGATYLIAHLVAVLLVVGTGVIPFGGALYSIALHVVLPVASVYGWTIFFHDPETDLIFWRRVVWTCCLRSAACVLIQKTLGDFVFHIVWEIFLGICLVGLGFLGMIWLRRGGSAGAQVHTPLPLPLEERINNERSTREIH